MQDQEDSVQGLAKAFLILRNAKETKLAGQIFQKLVEKIKFVKLNWINESICSTFPKVDVRCFAFCCPPSKECPFRNAVLEKLGKGIDDYADYKNRFGEKIKKDFLKDKELEE